MKVFLVVSVSVLAGIFLLLLVLRLVFSAVRRTLQAEIRKRFSDDGVILSDLSANFFGRLSAGRGQIRGNGALVLTGEELFFLMALPRRRLSLPLADIERVRLGKSFLGKGVFHPLLKVEFVSPTGRDEAAWAVKEPEKWQAAIHDLRSS